MVKSSSLCDLQGVWDELDTWHSRLTLLESEVQDLVEDHPGQAHLLMDQLTEPLQLYQNAAHMAEHRTAFLSKARNSHTLGIRLCELGITRLVELPSTEFVCLYFFIRSPTAYRSLKAFCTAPPTGWVRPSHG